MLTRHCATYNSGPVVCKHRSDSASYPVESGFAAQRFGKEVVHLVDAGALWAGVEKHSAVRVSEDPSAGLVVAADVDAHAAWGYPADDVGVVGEVMEQVQRVHQVGAVVPNEPTQIVVVPVEEGSQKPLRQMLSGAHAPEIAAPNFDQLTPSALM